MRQCVLDRCVARATGESVSQIRSMGFSLMVMPRVGRPSKDSRRRLSSHLRDRCGGARAVSSPSSE